MGSVGIGPALYAHTSYTHAYTHTVTHSQSHTPSHLWGSRARHMQANSVRSTVRMRGFKKARSRCAGVL